MSGLQSKVHTNGKITLKEGTIRKFKANLRHELILSEDAGYRCCALHVECHDRAPPCCLSAADVL